jgi:hypothetical protein
MPALDLGTQPQHRTTTAEVDHWARHVGPLVLVLADGVAMRQAEDPRDVTRINEVVDQDAPRHAINPTPVIGCDVHP